MFDALPVYFKRNRSRNLKLFLFVFFAAIASVPNCLRSANSVQTGADVLFSGDLKLLAGKRVGLVTHQAAYHKKSRATWQTLIQKSGRYRVQAIFAPEHGLFSNVHAAEKIEQQSVRGKDGSSIQVFSLYGKTRKPTPDMLKELDLLLVDLQDVGMRYYTYISTLLYVMEAAAAAKLPVIVLDRPNPLGGEMIDGPILQAPFRSFIGCAEVPICHGMTMGELARFFNHHFQLNCKLSIIAMRHYSRNMTFRDTGLEWVPTSPYIPEKLTPFHYASMGLLGELNFVSHGVGYTLPFRVLGGPRLNALALTDQLCKVDVSGFTHIPFHFTPFYAKFANQSCQGVLIIIDEKEAVKAQWRPFGYQMKVMKTLRRLHPQLFSNAIAKLVQNRLQFDKHCGTKDVLDALASPDPQAIDQLLVKTESDIAKFRKMRAPHLIKAYH